MEVIDIVMRIGRLLAELLMYLFRFASSHGDEEEDEELSETSLMINGPGS